MRRPIGNWTGVAQVLSDALRRDRALLEVDRLVGVGQTREPAPSLIEEIDARLVASTYAPLGMMTEAARWIEQALRYGHTVGLYAVDPRFRSFHKRLSGGASRLRIHLHRRDERVASRCHTFCAAGHRAAR